MIIIQFWGGLGNQMFEYAFYLKMRKIYDKVDTDVFFYAVDPNKPDRKSQAFMMFPDELKDAFGIEIPKIKTTYVAKYSNFYPGARKGAWFFSKIFDLRSMIFGDKPSYISPDDPTGYYPGLYELSPLRSWYLRSFWLNEKYFSDIQDEVKASFRFKNTDPRNTALIEKMQNENSVSIHVRNWKAHEVGQEDIAIYLQRDYYEKAIEIIKSKVENPVFYVFTNDANWAKERVDGLVEYQLVDHNTGKNSHLDMLLMSKCKHNIISNSTFGFWGAYLNENPDKIVISSKYPHTVEERHPFSCDDWIHI